MRLVTLPDSTLLAQDALALSALASWSASPGGQVSATPAPVAGDAARPTQIALPPAYAGRELVSKSVDLPAVVTVPAGSVVVWTDGPATSVAGYATAPVDGGSISPIFLGGRRIEIQGSGHVTVHVYPALKALRARER